MKIEHVKAEILYFSKNTIQEQIEYCGRICYASGMSKDKKEQAKFIIDKIKRGHNSVLEFGTIAIKINSEFGTNVFEQFKYIDVTRLNGREITASGTVRAWREILPNLLNVDRAMFNCLLSFVKSVAPICFYDINCLPIQPGETSINISHAEVLCENNIYVKVKFIVNRAISHELVRHRPCSFLQESQRYCRYDQDKFGSEITFIQPLFFALDSAEFQVWQTAMARAEKDYLTLLQTASPQAARTVLPNSCKTELIVQASLSQWRHIFKLRTHKTADPSMRDVMIPLKKDFEREFPEVDWR